MRASLLYPLGRAHVLKMGAAGTSLVMQPWTQAAVRNRSGNTAAASGSVVILLL